MDKNESKYVFVEDENNSKVIDIINVDDNEEINNNTDNNLNNNNKPVYNGYIPNKLNSNTSKY